MTRAKLACMMMEYIKNCRKPWSSSYLPLMGAIGLATAVVMLVGPRAVGDRLRDDADVVYAGQAKRVHDSGKAAEGNSLIAAEEHAFLLVLQLIADSGAELMNIDGLIAEINALSLINGDDEALLVDFLDR